MRSVLGSLRASARLPDGLVWAVALTCAVVPLWSSFLLPLVDLPQHLHLISALHRLDDPATLYPEFFARRHELTPYLGYYYAVDLLQFFFSTDTANRIFLSGYVVAFPLTFAFLLRSLGRDSWPALLTIPFAYGDSFSWGFINYCSALPWALVAAGCFVRAIERVERRRAWATTLAVALVLVLLFHVQVFAWLGLALPWLLFTTPAQEGKTWRARVPALLGVLPAVLLFVLWVGLRLGQPAEIAPGQPWHSWGPLLSPENLAWKSFDQNLAELVRWRDHSKHFWERVEFPLLAGTTRDGSDQNAIRLAVLVALLATLAGLSLGRAADAARGPRRLRLLGLALLAFLLFFALPFDIRGYMYYLNTRYMHLAVPLLLCAVPPLMARVRPLALGAALLVSPLLMLPLREAFQAFDRESSALLRVAAAAGPKPQVMGLIYNTGSFAVRHPVYVHASAVVARLRGGVTNFSFALTPHNPLLYRRTPLPTFASEWRPGQMRWEQQGRHYDHFVVRGRPPEQVFGARLTNELFVAAEQHGFFLVRRR